MTHIPIPSINTQNHWYILSLRPRKLLNTKAVMTILPLLNTWNCDAVMYWGGGHVKEQQQQQQQQQQVGSCMPVAVRITAERVVYEYL